MSIKIASTKIEIHGIQFKCRIYGVQDDSGSSLYSPAFDVSFDICKTPLESC